MLGLGETDEEVMQTMKGWLYKDFMHCIVSVYTFHVLSKTGKLKAISVFNVCEWLMYIFPLNLMMTFL